MDYSGHFDYGLGSSSDQAGPSTPPASGSQSKRQRRESSSELHQNDPSSTVNNNNNTTSTNTNRVQLACFYCRSKRIKCNGIKPKCDGCLKANALCEWPKSRAKKRTKKQMEEARLKEQSLGGGGGVGVGVDMLTGGLDMNMSININDGFINNNNNGDQIPNTSTDSTFSMNPLDTDSSQMWNLPSSSSYMWSTDYNQNPLPITNNNSGGQGSLPMSMMDYSTTGNSQQQRSQQLNQSLSLSNVSDIRNDTNNNNINPNSTSSTSTNLSNNGVMLAPQTVLSSNNDFLDNNSIAGTTMTDLGLCLPTNWSPSADLRLANALEDQMAFISGNPEEDKDLELYYYRFSGSTAIHPGINRISLKLQRRSATSPLAAPPQPGDEESPSVTSSSYTGPSPSELFDQDGMPHPHVWKPLSDLFFKHCSQHFPSVSRQRMIERIETGTMSGFLACCICSLGARFSGGSFSTLNSPDNDDDEDDKDQNNNSKKDKNASSRNKNNFDPSLAALPFIAKAQELIIPLLHLPTHDVVTGLLFLSWGNYGQNSESGLWQYSGMSIRMAIDLGIHENSELYESQGHLIRTRLLFWSLFITDRIIAFATGRPVSIQEDIIEIPLPKDEDFFPDPSRNHSSFSVSQQDEKIEPIPFVQLVKLMIICGRISNVLNSSKRNKSKTLAEYDPTWTSSEEEDQSMNNNKEIQNEQEDENEDINGNNSSSMNNEERRKSATAREKEKQDRSKLISELQIKLIKFISNLPLSLKWSAENFKHQHKRGHGSCFLTLHLWSNSILTLIYHPDLLTSSQNSGIETPLNKSLDKNIKLSLASSRQICECMVFADLVDSTSYTSAPYLTQPLFVAAMAFIHEMKSLSISSSDPSAPSSNSSATDILMLSMAKQNFQALLNATQKMEHFWAGAAYVAQILEKRSGFPRSSKRRSNKKTFISLPDTGLLKRFTTDRQHPSNIAPPTETSLRESIARSERSESFSNSVSALASDPTPFWLADLMSGYTVQNMSFAPADTLDLERLLASGSSMSGFDYNTSDNNNSINNNESNDGFSILRGNGNGSGNGDTPASGGNM
ncbi:uncharacterized protein L201_007300 [Kwoniella dendrophila CBS 6074]|uniref:Zn(2)-C6 fungal-type domain-containing protein n=1 Tax=Kwoniella dendrophila CBS 6074 TaxID=1295534 RepID=A0AAX4K6B4_9TREE